MEQPAAPEAGKPHFMGSMLIVYVAALLFFAIGAVTTPQLGWYETLAIPSWTPSEFWIAAIWCLLFVSTAMSMSLFWEHPARGKAFSTTALLYMGNGLLIILWNYLFFGLHGITAAFWVAVLVAISVALIIVRVRSVSPASAYLLAPYLIWVLFAAYLLHSITLLN